MKNMLIYLHRFHFILASIRLFMIENLPVIFRKVVKQFDWELIK